MTNDALKEEVRRLQLALVDKFRGRNKMIGGSQFRVSNPKKSGESDNCSDCAALRNGIKSLRFECRDLRSCVGDLQSQVSFRVCTVESDRSGPSGHRIFMVDASEIAKFVHVYF